MQGMGKQHPPALDVQEQRTICARWGGRSVGAARLPAEIADTTWTAPTQLFSWHGKGSWRKLRFTAVCGD